MLKNKTFLYPMLCNKNNKWNTHTTYVYMYKLIKILIEDIE